MNVPMHAQYVTPELVEELLGVGKGSLGSIGWLVIQEQATGTSRAAIAKALGCSEAELLALRDDILQATGEEAESRWLQGVMAVQTANRIQVIQAENGWDALEAMAIDKLGRSLNQMTTNGDPEIMLRIAQTSNKAIRRRRGEGPGTRGAGVTSVTVNGGMGTDNFGVELKSGHLGTLKLNISPRVQAQLANPERVIDGVAKPVEPVAAGRQDDLQMLSLNDTRQLVTPVKVIEVSPPKDFKAYLEDIESNG